jgi:hypothetical protein
MQRYQAISQDLVLVGGGHAHVHVLKSFGMRPVPGVRVSLVAPDVETPYSGMLPGHVAGHYSFEECHIDLGRLARFAGARLICDEAIGLDRAGGFVLSRAHPPIRWDFLSIDIGSAPQAHRAGTCTDVTGFGLLGHLLEMLCASGMNAVLDPDAVPALDSALALLGRGITSSLHVDNVAALAALGADQNHPIAPLLIDPQTAGGLLAGVPADLAVACCARLCELGYRAAVIGRVVPARGSDPRVDLEAGAADVLPESLAAS